MTESQLHTIRNHSFVFERKIKAAFLQSSAQLAFRSDSYQRFILSRSVNTTINDSLLHRRMRLELRDEGNHAIFSIKVQVIGLAAEARQQLFNFFIGSVTLVSFRELLEDASL